MIRVAEGMGGLALILGLGGTLYSLLSTVEAEIAAVSQVRVVRAELGAAGVAVAAHPEDPVVRRQVDALLDDLTRSTNALPRAMQAVVLVEVRGVRAAFEALLGDELAPARPEAPRSVARTQRALTRLQEELTAARRARLDRSAVLGLALKMTSFLFVVTSVVFAVRMVRAYQEVEEANGRLEERLARRASELRLLRGDLARTTEELHRAEERVAEAFSDIRDVHRARAELQHRLEEAEALIESRTSEGADPPASVPLASVPARASWGAAWRAGSESMDPPFPAPPRPGGHHNS